MLNYQRVSQITPFRWGPESSLHGSTQRMAQCINDYKYISKLQGQFQWFAYPRKKNQWDESPHEASIMLKLWSRYCRPMRGQGSIPWAKIGRPMVGHDKRMHVVCHWQFQLVAWDESSQSRGRRLWVNAYSKPSATLWSPNPTITVITSSAP